MWANVAPLRCKQWKHWLKRLDESVFLPNNWKSCVPGKFLSYPVKGLQRYWQSIWFLGGCSAVVPTLLTRMSRMKVIGWRLWRPLRLRWPCCNAVFRLGAFESFYLDVARACQCPTHTGQWGNGSGGGKPKGKRRGKGKNMVKRNNLLSQLAPAPSPNTLSL